jgi:hypothetical protein
VKTQGGWIVLAAIVLGLVLIVVLFALPISKGRPWQGTFLIIDASAALAIITGGAVAIERILEIGWTIVDLTKGSDWPSGPEVKKINEYVVWIIKRVDDFATTEPKWQGITEQAQTMIGKLQDTAAKLATVTSNDDLSSAAALVDRQITELKARFPELSNQQGLNQMVNEVSMATNDLKSYLDTFSDNPTRKVISLFAGSIIGMVAAYLLWLNIYQAAIGGSTTAPSYWVPITGLVIGLGSNPTHEVIQAIKQYKSST